MGKHAPSDKPHTAKLAGDAVDAGSDAGRARGGGRAGGTCRLATLVKELFGIGLMGFGGGSALIPVLQERLVGKQGACLLSKRDFEDDVAVACITPGALPVEIAAGVGLREAGPLGMLAASCVIAAPGVMLLVAALLVLSLVDDALIAQINFLAAGVCAFIISVIWRYAAGALQRGSSVNARRASAAVVVLAFTVTCEDVLHTLLQDDMDSLFGISMVNATGLTFFFACWIRNKRTPARIAVAVAVAGLFCLGKGDVLDAGLGRLVCWVTTLAMLVMAIASIVGDVRERDAHLHLDSPKWLIGACAASLLFAVALALPALLVCQDTLAYLGKGALSSIASFGGGDAYITMADGMFVQSGMVDSQDFYARLVPFANALPGSILTKVLAGVGFIDGSYQGDAPAGLAMALAGFGCAVSMSCITFAVGRYFYDVLRQLESFKTLKRVIGCVVAGMLATVAISLLNSSVGGAAIGGVGKPHAVALCLVLAAVNIFLNRRVNAHPLIAVVGSAAVAVVVCNLLAM